MAKIISFINYKGGVGKTTTTYHIGCSLAQHHNKKVLFVDVDAQTNLTFLCAPHEEWLKHKKRAGTIATMYQQFLDRKALDIKRSIWRMPIQITRGRISNLDLLPCDVDLLGEDLGGGQITGTFPTLEALKRQASEYLRERLFLRNAGNRRVRSCFLHFSKNRKMGTATIKKQILPATVDNRVLEVYTQKLHLSIFCMSCI